MFHLIAYILQTVWFYIKTTYTRYHMIFIPLSFRVMSPLTQLTPRFQQGHVISIANQPSIGWPWSYRGQLWPLMVNRRVASYWRIFLWWIWGWFAWIYWWFMRIYMDSQICIYIYRYLFVILWLIYMDLLVIYIYIYIYWWFIYIYGFVGIQSQKHTLQWYDGPFCLKSYYINHWIIYVNHIQGDHDDGI